VTHSDLVTLIDYNYWARDRLLGAVAPLPAEQFTRDLGSSFRSIRDTLVHTYSAEWVWFSRWQGESPTSPIPFDRFADVASLASAWRELEQGVRAFVVAQTGAAVERVYDYQLMNGSPGRTPFWQMVHHVVNHGAYHRGQVVTMLRQLGAKAISTDAIAYYRERGT
jgi:uncharacterized damage-inducible protein DinB